MSAIAGLGPGQRIQASFNIRPLAFRFAGETGPSGIPGPAANRRLPPGEKVVDIGSGAGFDSFIAAGQVGPGGQVAGIDMTAEMLAKSRQTAEALGLAQVQFREGLAEALPAQDAWADVVISNGVINLCAG